MSIEVAKKAVDYILSEKKFLKHDSVVWDFIGGEPTLEMKLIDEICEYILKQMYLLKHPWFNKYRFMIGSNGLLYNSKPVQDFIKKYLGNVSMAITIDGNQIKHDLSRVKPDGSGSYLEVEKNFKLYMKQLDHEGTTKSTFAHADLPHLKDSVVHLWNLGIKYVMANVVFEDVWQEGDVKIFEDQLMQLADYVVEHNLWEKCSVRFFDPNIGFPLPNHSLNSNFCGTGTMMAINTEGKLYPCIRFVDFGLTKQKGYEIGDIYNGVDCDKLRPFYALTTKDQSTEECLNCPIASGCCWCSGFNYDDSSIGTLYERKIYHCELQKANIRANKYLWDKYTEKTGNISPRRENELKNVSQATKYLYFLTDSNTEGHCYDPTKSDETQIMSDEIFQKGMEFAKNNDYQPVMLGKSMEGYHCITDADDYDSAHKTTMHMYNMDDNFDKNAINKNNFILKVQMSQLKNLPPLVEYLMQNLNGRININVHLVDIDKYDDSTMKQYEKVLSNLSNILYNDIVSGNNRIRINILSILLKAKRMQNCNAGDKSITLAPNGELYICPAFYYDKKFNPIGNLEDGLNPDYEHYKKYCSLEKSPLCSKCDCYQCKRCVYKNKTLTTEYNIPSENQCLISHLERTAASKLLNMLKQKNIEGYSDISIKPIDYKDPIELFAK